ncbi:MAG: MarC family protein [Planktomarina sp.]
METALIIGAFATLFVVIDPIGMAPIFVALTQGMESRQRRAIATRACLIAAGVLLVFAAFGEALLDFIGISMSAFRIAGGILLFITALQMLFEERSKKREEKGEEAAAEDDRDPSVFPLAIPLIGGPGAIATIILLVGQADGNLIETGIYVGVMLGVLFATWCMFMLAGPMERALGKTGIIVVTRLLGMLLAALSVQFVLDGLRDFGVGLS